MNLDFSQMVTAQDKATEALAATKDTVAAKRFERETAGLTYGGMEVYTDRTTQMKLTGVALRAYQDSTYTVDWKLSDGTFKTLTAAEIVAVASAVADYVQACYARESVLVAAVDAGTYTVDMLEAQVSSTVTDGWPAQS